MMKQVEALEDKEIDKALQHDREMKRQAMAKGKGKGKESEEEE